MNTINSALSKVNKISLVVIFILTLVFAQTFEISAGSDSSYKSSCKKIPVSELTKKADSLKGQKVTYTGKVLVMDFPQKSGAPYGLIISVKDPSKTLPSGVLPVYVTFKGKANCFIYDMVTIYGKVYGNYSYKSPAIKQKTLPRVDALYLNKVTKK